MKLYMNSSANCTEWKVVNSAISAKFANIWRKYSSDLSIELGEHYDMHEIVQT